MAIGIQLAENFPIPESIIRYGIRGLLKKRLAQEGEQQAEIARYLDIQQKGLISLASKEANQQHYELPYEFFIKVLGKYLKYSGSTFHPGVTDLSVAERDSLEEIIERAQIQDGHKILELGCGWGSFSLYTAQKFPNCQITAVSNSRIQREYILATAESRQITNLQVITADINNLVLTEKYNRIVSVEMFEHLRNYSLLFEKIASWLQSDGLMFVHIFCHQRLCYFFDEGQKDQWMARYFFAGGIMPSKDLFYQFNQHLQVIKQWDVLGTNYEKTANAWATNLREQQSAVMPILEDVYGKKDAKVWFRRWMIFFLACAELFGYQQGQEWMVSHYLFEVKNG